MELAEILSLISTISYVVAGICLALALLFWFVFRIPKVMGDLSGRTAKKSIAKMRARNERAGGKGFQPSATNAQRGKLTTPAEKVPAKAQTAPKQKQNQPPAAQPGAMPETSLLDANKANAEIGEQTSLLSDPAATQLLQDPEATELLTDPNATTLLQETPPAVGGMPMTMLDDVMLIHTEERIPL